MNKIETTSVRTRVNSLLRSRRSPATAHFEINDKNGPKKTQNREIILSRNFTHLRGSRIHNLEHLPSFRRTVVENPLEETHSFPLECGKKDE